MSDASCIDNRQPPGRLGEDVSSVTRPSLIRLTLETPSAACSIPELDVCTCAVDMYSNDCVIWLVHNGYGYFAQD